MWKNMEDFGILSAHILWLPIRLAHSLFTGKFEFVSAFFKALPRLKEAVSRRKPREYYVLSDKKIFEISENI